MGLVLFYATLGWVGGPGRIDFTYEFDLEPVTGFLLHRYAPWPATGRCSATPSRHIILPASILAFGALAYISRMTRSFMIEQLSQEYVVTARVEGPVLVAHGVGACLPQHRRAGRDRRGALLRLPAGRGGADRDGLRLAGLRPLPDQCAAGRRHECRGRLHAARSASSSSTLNLLCDLLYRIFDPRTR